jgi:hypothetical protein
MNVESEVVNGTKRGFGAASTSKSGRPPHRSKRSKAFSDEAGVAAARIARAFHVLLGAAMAGLRCYYASRLSGLRLRRGGDARAAIAALIQERNAAFAQLFAQHQESRRRATWTARRQAGRKAQPAFERIRAGARGPIRPRRGRIGMARRRPYWSRP